MKTFVSANELCNNLAVGAGNGPDLKAFLLSKNIENRKSGKGIAFCREKALPVGQEFVKRLREQAKEPERVGVHVSKPRRKRAAVKPDGMLLVIPLGRNETMTVTMKRAREIFDELTVIFGRQV